MNKLIIVLLIALIPGIGKAQKNFEGEISFTLFRLNRTSKDTIFGDLQKFIISNKAIRIESFNQYGDLFQVEIVYLDSLKSIVMSTRYHVYWNSWKGSVKRNVTALPWDMEKVKVMHTDQKVLGYDTFINHLTAATPDYGYVEMNEAKDLFFKLPPQIGRGLFLTGCFSLMITSY